jgi:hypothetical protein
VRRLVAGLLLSVAAVPQEVPYVGREEALPKPVAAQPVAFSHRVHIEKTGLGCDFCHAEASKGDAASLPPLDLCLACHRSIKADSPEVAKLSAAATRGERIAWVPVYRVPDYVFFGHAPHIKAGHTCAECHGPVATRDTLQKEVSTSMTACFACHRRVGARQDCVACHQLGH